MHEYEGWQVAPFVNPLALPAGEAASIDVDRTRVSKFNNAWLRCAGFQIDLHSTERHTHKPHHGSQRRRLPPAVHFPGRGSGVLHRGCSRPWLGILGPRCDICGRGLWAPHPAHELGHGPSFPFQISRWAEPPCVAALTFAHHRFRRVRCPQRVVLDQPVWIRVPLRDVPAWVGLGGRGATRHRCWGGH